MKYNRLLAIPLMLALLTNCAVMSEQECQLSDWQSIGFIDGESGSTAAKFNQYREACAEFGISADFQAWQTGRHEGLVSYCQPRRGFVEGTEGRRYNNVCSVELEPAFLQGYRLGEELNQLHRNVRAFDSAIYEIQTEIEDIDEAIAEVEAIIIVAETTPEEREELLVELKNLNEARSTYVSELDYLYAERDDAESETTAFEQEVRAAGF